MEEQKKKSDRKKERKRETCLEMRVRKSLNGPSLSGGMLLLALKTKVRETSVLR